MLCFSMMRVSSQSKSRPVKADLYLGVVGNQKFLVKPISFFFKVDFCMVFAKNVF